MKQPRTQAYYQLDEVRECIGCGRVYVWDTARMSALRDFGWSQTDLLNAVQTLTPGEFHKSMKADQIRGAVLDVYRKKLEPGLEAYIKFHVDDARGYLLVVVSCKER